MLVRLLQRRLHWSFGLIMTRRFQHFESTTWAVFGRVGRRCCSRLLLCGPVSVMLLAGKAADLKAKLTRKGGKCLPTAAIMKLMPAGTNHLNEVPTLMRFLEVRSVVW